MSCVLLLMHARWCGRTGLCWVRWTAVARLLGILMEMWVDTHMKQNFSRYCC